MPMNYKITHNTQYSYNSLVNLCHNEARLTPRSFAQQVCTQSEFTVDPEPTSYRERKDFSEILFAILQSNVHIKI